MTRDDWPDRPRATAPCCAGLPTAGSRRLHRPTPRRQQCNRRFACSLARPQPRRLLLRHYANGRLSPPDAGSTDALFTQRANAVASMSAVDNMHSYAQIARAYADNIERLATAFDSLYASLTDTQKQAADTLFRQQAAAAAQPRTRR